MYDHQQHEYLNVLIFNGVRMIIEMRKVVEDKGDVIAVERNIPFVLLMRVAGLPLIACDTLE